MAAAVLAVAVANSPVTPVYFVTLENDLGPLSVLHRVSDAVMAIFFLLVSLDIEREFVDGHLAPCADRRPPIIAAAAGMIIPALVRLKVVCRSAELARG